MKDAERFHLLLRKYLVQYLPASRCVSPATLRTYKQAINDYRSYLKAVKNIRFESVDFGCFTRDFVHDYMVWLREEKGASPNTINLRLSALKSLLRFCGEEDIELMACYISISSIRQVKGGKKPCVDYLTQDQLKLLFSLPDTGTHLGRRNRFFMIFAYEVGARMQEALGMKVRDVVFSEGDVRVRVEGKGSKVRYVPLLASAVGHLVAYLDEFHPLRAPDDYLFYTVHDGNKTQMCPGAVDAFLKKYSAQAIEFDASFPVNLHEHMLRHSIAMAMYKKGIPLSYIRDFLGHACVDSSRVYAYSDSETIKQALQAANSLIDSEDGQRLKNDVDYSKTLMEFCGLV